MSAAPPEALVHTHRPLSLVSLLALLTPLACAPPEEPVPEDAPVALPAAGRDLARDIEHMDLVVDTRTLTGEAAVRVAPSESTALTLEVGDLDILRVVTLDDVELQWQVVASTDVSLSPNLLDIGLPAFEDTVVILYLFTDTGRVNGYSDEGYTMTFPGNCGNLFPCHSDPADGLTWTVDVTSDLPVITADVTVEAPSYMLAWREADLRPIALGTSSGGVELVAFTNDALEPAVRAGTERLVTIFSWLEDTLGPYAFGARAGTVPAPWGVEGLGGMEHHPYWHVNESDVDWPMVQAHEAAHGWFGDAVRVACWEDIFVSEGIVSYLGLRGVEIAYGEAVAQADWDLFRFVLNDQVAFNDHKARPDGCNDMDPDAAIDFVVYGKGAFFLKAVATEVGPELLDAALGDFYLAHHGKTASVEQVLAALNESTGFDTTALAQAWLYGEGIPSPALGGF